MSKQTNENNDKGILSGIWGAFAERRKNNVLYQKFLHRLVNPKRRFLVPINKEKTQYAVATFKMNFKGTPEFEGIRAVSQSEAKEIIDSARDRGWGLDDNENVTRFGRELSAKENEVFNSAKKQLRERYGHLLEKNQDGQSVLNSTELVAKNSVRPKTAATQKANGSLKNASNSAISNSLKRINEKTSALNISKDSKNQQFPKFPKIWALHAKVFIYFLIFNSELQNSLFSSFFYTVTVVSNGYYNYPTSTL